AGLPEGRADLREAGIPAYIFPEAAARALAAMYRYRRWLERPPGEVREFDVDRETVRGILERGAAEGADYLSRDDVIAVLDAYGIATLRSAHVKTADEAAAAARTIG